MISVGLAISLVAITSYGISCWFKYAKHADPFLTPAVSGHPSGEKPFGFLDMAFFFFAWFGIPLFAFKLVAWTAGSISMETLTDSQKQFAILLAVAGQLFVCGLALAIFSRRYGSLSESLGLSPKDFWSHFQIGAKWFAMTVPAVLALQALLNYLIPYHHPTLDRLQDNFSLATVAATWFGATIAAPISEELLVRGVFQGWLQRFNQRKDPENAMLDIIGGWPVHSESDNELLNPSGEPQTGTMNRGFWMPIVISSALFAVMHASQGAAPLVLFFFGLVLGFLYRQTGSIIPCIVLHFLLNAFTMFWATLDMVSRSMFST